MPASNSSTVESPLKWHFRERGQLALLVQPWQVCTRLCRVYMHASNSGLSRAAPPGHYAAQARPPSSIPVASLCLLSGDVVCGSEITLGTYQGTLVASGIGDGFRFSPATTLVVSGGTGEQLLTVVDILQRRTGPWNTRQGYYLSVSACAQLPL